MESRLGEALLYEMARRLAVPCRQTSPARQCIVSKLQTFLVGGVDPGRPTSAWLALATWRHPSPPLPTLREWRERDERKFMIKGSSQGWNDLGCYTRLGWCPWGDSGATNQVAAGGIPIVDRESMSAPSLPQRWLPKPSDGWSSGASPWHLV